MPETLRDAETIFRAGLTRVDPLAMMQRVLTLTGDILRVTTETECQVYDLSRYRRIFVLGMGKASARMARGLERLLGERITGGVVAVKEGYLETLSRIRLLESAHPVPDERGVAAAYYDHLAEVLPDWAEGLTEAAKHMRKCAEYGGYLWRYLTMDEAGYEKFARPDIRKALADEGWRSMAEDEAATAAIERLLAKIDGRNEP